MANPSKHSALARANAAADNNQNGTHVGETKQSCPVFDVIVLVAGTVDPLNNDADKLANSFNKYDRKAHDPRFTNESQPDSDYYWTGNQKFIEPVLAFQKTYDHVHVFRDHSWTGDNCVKNRDLAGKILGDWLCGNAMEPALPAWLKRKVSFHFVGHSHGGNVINEVTKRISHIGKWPGDWKVKSVVYLSTPFFQTIHFPQTARFHGKARICNAYCQYDLTQTAIADFSLRQLTRVTNVVVASKTTLMPIVDRIAKFDTSSLDALKVLPKTRTYMDGWVPKVTMEWNMDPTAGRNLYDRLLALFKDIKLVIGEVEGMVTELNKEVRIRISEVFQGKGLFTKRKIISDAMKDRIIAELHKVLAGLAPAEAAFKARITSGVYPVRGFISDLHTESLVLTLVNLLNVNPATLDGVLTGLLYDAFKEQIEVFDDTLATCDHHYKGAYPIVPVDVTPHDGYYKKRDPQFYSFKSRLIKAEQAYMGGPTKFRFLDMLFILAAQLDEIRQYLPTMDKVHGYLNTLVSWWTKVDSSSSFILRIQDINTLLQSWILVLRPRDCGGIVWDGAARDPKYGSVPYLAVVSHSVSRQALYPDIDTFLRAQFDSHEVKAKR